MGGLMQDFEELRVWKTAHQLMLDIYRATREFPRHERFGGMTSQMQRAAVSISANIAEGSKRESAGEYAHYLNVAEGSAAELRALILGCRDLQYLASEHAAAMLHTLSDVSRMLHRLKEAVRRHRPTTSAAQT